VAAGVDVVRRATGGGAVWVAPGAQVWLDLWVPRGDALWEEDIVRSATWLGEAWVAALEGLGHDGSGAGALRVHHGRATRHEWADLVCFAGLGPGEVVSAQRKVVGIAQRRTREGARFHTLAPLTWDPAPLVALLEVGERGGSGLLAHAAMGVGALLHASRPDLAAEALLGAVETAVIAALP
jgi:lipoate-protein ligase A